MDLIQNVLICLIAFFISVFTFYAGFGLGTMLMPVFAVFFPVDVAIALTAVVHFLNNIFKLVLLGRHADKKIVFLFGFPAIWASFFGAQVLFWLKDLTPLVGYKLFGNDFFITPIKLTIACLIIIFILIDLIPRSRSLSFDKKYLPVGGLLSGFFGGLSGLQGALRSAFLIKYDLTKESFIATGVVIACLVDMVRIFVYGAHWQKIGLSEYGAILSLAVISAFLGVLLANKFFQKMTMNAMQKIIAGMLLMIALLLGMGII